MTLRFLTHHQDNQEALYTLTYIDFLVSYSHDRYSHGQHGTTSVRVSTIFAVRKEKLVLPSAVLHVVPWWVTPRIEERFQQLFNDDATSRTTLQTFIHEAI